jgi:hypothetical protein
MKSKRLRRLQTWTIIVLFLYMLLLGYSLVIPFQNGILFAVTAKWSQQMAERRIESDKSVQESQSDLLVDAQNLSHALQVKSKLLSIYFDANIAMIGFLGWSTFMIYRIKREVDHDA